MPSWRNAAAVQTLSQVAELIEYRPFRNSDAPLVADVWRSQAMQRGLMQPMSAALFESLVLAKPIFDRQGLILAVEGGRALGFAHAAFGANVAESGLSTESGVVGMLMVRSGETESTIAAELLKRVEGYLRAHGARSVLAGGGRLLDPSYLGLYGGSELSGILQSDAAAGEFYLAHGYRETGRSLVLHRELARFRPTVDRQQMQIRRRTSLVTAADPTARTWWDACTYGGFDRTRFELHSRDGGAAIARATFWNMELLAANWGLHAAGLVELEVAAAERKQGLATYLLGEAFRLLHAEGTALVEGHVAASNEPARALFKKLGFEEVDQTIVYCKDFSSATT